GWCHRQQKTGVGMKPHLSGIFLVFLLFTSLLSAQGTEAVLSGNIIDSSGAVVIGATVTATNIQTGVATVTKSNSSGVYLFASLPPGSYRLASEAAGFKKLVVDQTTL